jgi:hypothetical protein
LEMEMTLYHVIGLDALNQMKVPSLRCRWQIVPTFWTKFGGLILINAAGFRNDGGGHSSDPLPRERFSQLVRRLVFDN